MSRGVRRRAPVVFASVAMLVAALGGTVYAAGKINGHAVKLKSLPGNRLALHSVPGNRLKPRSIRAEMLAPGSVGAAQLAPGSISGAEIDAGSLGEVPSAGHAEKADLAQSAKDAETALIAAMAQDARTVNGFEAGCKGETRLFAGACWQVVSKGPAVTAQAAAASCAGQGGELPSALALAVFALEPGIVIGVGDEWTSTVTNVSGTDLYAVVTVSPTGQISSELGSKTKRFRCVLPLLG
jgi:hypothetical protein